MTAGKILGQVAVNLSTELRRTYHLADVDPAHPIRRAADELERLGAERDALRAALRDCVTFIERDLPPETARYAAPELRAARAAIDAALRGE